MNKVRNRIIASALCVLLVCACVPMCAYALPVVCGENVLREYHSESGTYIFRGSGPMYDFDSDPDHFSETFDRVVIEAGVTYVGAYLFDSDYIGELVLPDTAIAISENAFFGCVIDRLVFPQTASNTAQYDFGDGNYSFGSAQVINLDLGGLDGFPEGFRFTYGDNYDLQTLIVGAATTRIPDNACNCFGALESLTLPEGLLEIGSGAFESCEMLHSVYIPDSVTTIGDYAFDYCMSLETLTLPKQLLTIGEGAFCCTSLSAVMIPDHTTSIGISAFENCESLTEVRIPDSVISIGINAFSGTALQSVHLPAGLQYIHGSSLGTSLTYVCCDTEDCPVIKQYAENAGVEFRLCSGHETHTRVAGDASGDGVLNLRDVVLIRRYLAGGWDVEIDAAAADVDGDGEATTQDVVLLSRYIAGGWDVELI